MLPPKDSQMPKEPVITASHAVLGPRGRRCSSCQVALSPGFSFCSHCGMSIEGRARLVSIEADGSEGGLWVLSDEETLLGKEVGPIAFDDDEYVSPRHCRLFFREDRLFVEDLESLNGVFRRVRGERLLSPGDHVRLGRQLLRIEPMAPASPKLREGTRIWGSPDPGYRARLVQILEGGGLGEIFPLKVGENLVGRESGDVAFPRDRFVSARHASVRVGSEGVTIRDLGSSNGTYVRLTQAIPLEGGDLLLLGNRLLRVELRAPAAATG